jgi:hypothetical protein
MWFERKFKKKMIDFDAFCPAPKGQGIWNSQFIPPPCSNTHHIKFEKNWSSGYQEEAKNVQLLTDTIYHVCPPLVAKLLPQDYKFHNFGRGPLALHNHAFSFSSTYAVAEKIFENCSILGTFCQGPTGAWTMKFTMFVPLHP